MEFTRTIADYEVMGIQCQEVKQSRVASVCTKTLAQTLKYFLFNTDNFL